MRVKLFPDEQDDANLWEQLAKMCPANGELCVNWTRGENGQVVGEPTIEMSVKLASSQTWNDVSVEIIMDGTNKAGGHDG